MANSKHHPEVLSKQIRIKKILHQFLLITWLCFEKLINTSSFTCSEPFKCIQIFLKNLFMKATSSVEKLNSFIELLY